MYCAQCPPRRRGRALSRFVTDPAVPVTNNGSERYIRPVKTQLKISGCHCATTDAHRRHRVAAHPRIHLHRPKTWRRYPHRTARRDHRKFLATTTTRSGLNSYLNSFFVFGSHLLTENGKEINGEVQPAAYIVLTCALQQIENRRRRLRGCFVGGQTDGVAH